MKKSSAAYAYGKRPENECMSTREKVRLCRLAAAAFILLAAVLLKLMAPAFALSLRNRFAESFSYDMDIREVVSAFGELAGGKGEKADRWSRVYEAVFAPQEETAELTAAEIVYTEDNIPARAVLMQEILGYDYAMPLTGTLSSGFGLRESPTLGSEEFHYGLDIAAPEGTEVHAFAAGTVRCVAESSSYGNYIILDHENDTATLYAHLKAVNAQAGETVEKGQTIALAGQTGNATGPHLHFELQKGGQYINPIYYYAETT